MTIQENPYIKYQNHLKYFSFNYKNNKDVKGAIGSGNIFGSTHGYIIPGVNDQELKNEADKKNLNFKF